MLAAYCAEATRRETSTIMQLVMMTASEERVKAESESAQSLTIAGWGLSVTRLRVID